MLRLLVRWCIPLASIFFIGPVAAMLVAPLRGPGGATDATALLSESPLRGLLFACGAILLAAVPGLLGGRLVGAKLGLFAAGLTLAWAAWATGSVDVLIRESSSTIGAQSALWRLSAESALLGLLAVALAAAIIAAAQHRRDADNNEPPLSVKDPTSFLGIAMAAVAAGLVVWMVAGVRDQSLKGQTFAAAALGGMLAATIGRVGVHRAPAIGFFVSMLILAVVGPAAAALLAGGGASADRALQLAVQAGTLFPLARPLPMDWIAGAFIGIPLGLSWAASMLEKHVEPQPA